MNAILNKTNNGKLIAAIVALAMIVCAVAVVASPAMADEGQTSTPTIPDFNGVTPITVDSVEDLTTYIADGVLTVPSTGLVLSLAEDIEISEIVLNGNLKITGGHTLTVSDVVTSNSDKYLITGGNNVNGNIVVDGTSTALVASISVDSAESTYNDDIHILYNVAGLFITNGATVTLNQTANTNGVTWYNSGNATFDVYMDDGDLSLRAAGLPDMDLFMFNQSNLNVNNTQNGTIGIENGSQISSSNITVTNDGTPDTSTSSSMVGYGTQVSIYGTVNMTDSTIDAGSKAINLGGNAVINMDSTSSLSAGAIRLFSGATSGATVNGGTVDAEFQKERTDGTTSQAITLSGTTVTQGSTTGSTIAVGNGGIVIAAEDEITFAGEFTNTDSNAILVSSGDVTFPRETVTDNIYVKEGATATNGTTTVEYDEDKTLVVTNIETLIAMAAEPNMNITIGNISGGNILNLTDNLVIADGTTITSDGQSAVIDITASGNTSYTIEKVGSGQVDLKIRSTTNGTNFFTISLNGAFTIQDGSVEIVDVSLNDENTITLRSGTIVLSGSLSGTLDFEMDTRNLDTTNVVFRDFTVNAGATVEFLQDSHVTYRTEDDFYLYGSLISKGTVNLNVGTATIESDFTAYPGAVIAQSVTLVNGQNPNSSINLDDSLRNMEISVDVTGDQVYSQMQNVTIVTSLDITPYASLTIYGQLVINEGVTLTIQDNAELIVRGDVAKMIVNGTIEVEGDGTISVLGADSVTVSGTITSEGTVDIQSNVTIEEGGSIFIDDADNSELTVTDGLTINAGGSVEVRGEMAQTSISNKGTVTLNGAVLSGAVNIYMAADGAVVDIRSFTTSNAAGANGSLSISDSGLVLEDNRDTDDVVVGPVTAGEGKVNSNGANGEYSYATPNVITFTGTKAQTGIRNLTITETVTYEQDRNDVNEYTYGMNIAGSVAVANEGDSTNPTYTVGLAGVNFNVVAETTLTLGAGITLNNDAVLNVAGTVYAVAGSDNNNTLSKIENGETINVSGMIETTTQINSGINAARYEADVEGNTHYYYTTLATAIANEADTIYIMGEVTILDNVTIPTDVTVRADGSAIMNIGDADHRDVVVSVTAGATVRSFTSGGYIDVYGTLEFADSGDSKGSNVIYSDVSVSADPAITYTNIYTALNGAEDGETVTITRTTTPVILDDDLSVRTGVTLVIPSNATVQIDDDVTFTIDGTVQKIGAITSTSTDGFNPLNSDNTEKDADAYAVIIVNGALMSRGQQVDYATDSTTGVVGYYIPGAYYRIVNTTGDWYYVTPVAQAATVSNDVYQGAIAINGENTVGDVDFTGDAQQAVTVTLNESASLEAGSVTLSYARIVITAADTVFDGTIDTAVGSIEFENITNVTVKDSFDDETEVMSVTGTPGAADDKVDAVMTVATGNVTVTGANLDVSGVDEFSIASGATLTVTGSGVVFSANWMTVDGTLVATDNGKIDANRVTVRGTLTVESRTADHNAGSAEIGQLYVGIAVNDRNDLELVDASAATVSADAIDQMTYMIVSADSTVTGDLIENLAATEYYVEDALWVTVYGTLAIATEETSGTGSNAVDYTQYTIQPGDLTESAFVSWTDADGRDVPADTANGADGYEQIYASINYDVYIVIVMTDNSIGSVAIDGQMLVYNYNIGGYIVPEMFLDAGQHTVTYTLAAGYEGTPTLTSNGVNATVSGMGFTLSGDYQDANGSINYNYLALGGATYSGNTVVIDGGNGGSNDMGLTDYLLIVLVILIVIMAIIVALRLMRS